MAIELSRLAGLALVFSPLAVASPAQAQSYDAAQLNGGTLEVPCNRIEVINAVRSISTVRLGSANIADVQKITARSIYVLGNKMGTTSLALYDSSGQVISVMNVAVGPDVYALADKIHELIPGETIDAHLANDSIVLTGTVNSAGAAARAAQLAQAFVGGSCAAGDKGDKGDKVINLINLGSSQQIMLEVRFAEVDRTALKDLGISATALSKGGSFSAVTGEGSQLVANATTGTLQLGAITSAFGIFTKSFGIGNTNINSIINALESRGFAKTLDQPTLVALSGEKASFLAGGEFPVPVVQSSSGGSTNAAITVQYKPFGVSLAFTATVLGDRTISMLVEPEVSAIDPASSITISGVTIPGLRTRRASTTLEMRDGESFAIAGLLQKDFKTTVDQLPGLGAIPILGALFRSTNFQKSETELLIVVTPHLVAPIRPNQVRLPTDRVSDPLESDTFLYGQAYRPEKLKPAAGQPLATVKPPQSSATMPTGSGENTGTPPEPSGASTAGEGDGYAY